MKPTIDQLKLVMPRMERNPKTCASLFPHLVAAMEEAEINTKGRIAAFLAQVAHESAEFKYMEEVWGPTPQQLKYEPPSQSAARLGNTQAGDGFRYRGRGPVQITGRENYRLCGQALGVDLVAKPELLCTPEYAFRSACWYWTKRKLNSLADAGDFSGITQRINGGYNGLESRLEFYNRALAVL